VPKACRITWAVVRSPPDGSRNADDAGTDPVVQAARSSVRLVGQDDRARPFRSLLTGTRADVHQGWNVAEM